MILANLFDYFKNEYFQEENKGKVEFEGRILNNSHSKQTKEDELFDLLDKETKIFANPHSSSLYNYARSFDREIVMHVGPTNSGKTFHALNVTKMIQVNMFLGILNNK